jgi:hypothetical protein
MTHKISQWLACVQAPTLATIVIRFLEKQNWMRDSNIICKGTMWKSYERYGRRLGQRKYSRRRQGHRVVWLLAVFSRCRSLRNVCLPCRRVVDQNSRVAFDWVPEKDVIVTFEFNDIRDWTLSEFNHQNVIASLSIKAFESGIKVRLEPCFGLCGTVLAKQVSITIEPGKPKDVTFEK